ncbi:lipopolysaccharide assembly protein LapA domain-containing protein [Sinomonas sp. JGH33]|uniref:Lipopolysaccharide assembly protein LapA domain-containing protein n=1 Tax=Sinomonas terricola TaxID=3110330 RepID=A0ABU5T567_9MICC|nr:lipopolysaccharide assembly protein LapA domain-containing protein [Sinomonas sp. JGH33]MEA5454296.1 lipopolysaccharide assembly protein LapA domain-containing protein [Sinomonas sp. JGH33]
MSQDPKDEPTREAPAPNRTGGQADEVKVTRVGAVWTAVVVGLAVLVFLIVFFLQNQDTVRVRFLGLDGGVPLGLALFIAAVAGGILVAIAGAARIIQLRIAAARRRRPPRSDVR